MFLLHLLHGEYYSDTKQNCCCLSYNNNDKYVSRTNICQMLWRLEITYLVSGECICILIVQDHSRSLIIMQIESLYVISC